MEAEILIIEKDRLKISWSDPEKGFGELNMWWDESQRNYIIDSELMTTETIVDIIKCAIKPSSDTVFSREECVFHYCPHPKQCKEKCMNA